MSSHPDEITRLEAMHAENPDGRVFAHLAEAYRKAGELDRARDVLEQGLQRHPDYASAHVVLGRVHLDQDDASSADSAFRRVLELDAQNLVALRARADIARAQGRSADAIQYYNDLLAVDPGDEHALAALEALGSGSHASTETEESAELDAGGLTTRGTDSAGAGLALAQDAEAGERSRGLDAASAEAPAGSRDEPAQPPVMDLGVELEPTDIGGGFGAAAEAPRAEEAPSLEEAPRAEETPSLEEAPRAEEAPAEEAARAPDDAAAADAEPPTPGDTEPPPPAEPEPATPADRTRSPEARGRSGLPGWSDTGEPLGAAPARAPSGDAADAGAPEAGEEAEAVRPRSVGAELVTETIGDLYARQGLHERAIDVYSKLLGRRPGDAGLEAKLADARAALEAGPQQPDTPARPEWSAVEEVQVPPVAEGAVRAEQEAEQLSVSEEDEQVEPASDEAEHPDWLEHATRPIESGVEAAPQTPADSDAQPGLEPEPHAPSDAAAPAPERETDAEASAMESRPDQEREQGLAGLPSEAWGESSVVEPEELGMEPAEEDTQDETEVPGGLELEPPAGRQEGPQQADGVDTSDLGLEPVGGGSDLFADSPPAAASADEAPVEEVEAAWTGGAGHEEPPESPFGWTAVHDAEEPEEPSIGEHFASILAGSAPERPQPAPADGPIAGPATDEAEPDEAAPAAADMDEIDALFAQTGASDTSQAPTAAASEPAPSPAGEAGAEADARPVSGSRDVESAAGERTEMDDIDALFAGAGASEPTGAGAGSHEETGGSAPGAAEPEAPAGAAGQEWDPFEALADVAGTGEPGAQPTAGPAREPGAASGAEGSGMNPTEAPGAAAPGSDSSPSETSPGDSSDAAPEEDDEDLEMFRAWLQSLKR